MKKIIPITVLALVLAIGVFVSSAQAATSLLTGWAWSSNIGWVSFNGANAGACPGAGPCGSYSVTIATTTPVGGTGTLGGYAWSSNIGWISFESAHVSSCPSVIPADPCQATVNMDTGKVTGWARALTAIADPSDGWDGWVHLSGLNHLSPDESGNGGVTYYPEAKSGHTAGSFAGYAWGSDVIGWLNFYNVATSVANVVPPPVCTIGNFSKNVSNKLQIETTVTPSSPAVLYYLKVSTNNGVTYNSAPVGSTNSGVSMPYVFTHNITLRPGSTYTYQIFVNDTVTTCGFPRSYVEPPVLPVSSGLRLLIAQSTVLDADLANVTNPYDDSAPEYQEISIKSGDQFKLKWNIAPELIAAGYDFCSGMVNPSSGPTGSWGDNVNGGQKTINTTGISGGQYTFILTCTKNGSSPKISTAKLYIISSSIRER